MSYEITIEQQIAYMVARVALSGNPFCAAILASLRDHAEWLKAQPAKSTSPAFDRTGLYKLLLCSHCGESFGRWSPDRDRELVCEFCGKKSTFSALRAARGDGK